MALIITSSWVGYSLPEVRQSSAQLEYLWVGLVGEAEAAAAASGELAMVSAGFTGEVRWVETLFFVLVLFVWSVDLAEAFTLALEMILIIFAKCHGLKLWSPVAQVEDLFHCVLIVEEPCCSVCGVCFDQLVCEARCFSDPR